MTAKRRSSGSGTVVALVIFIVLSFIGIGAALWLYQQNTILQSAIDENQLAFKGTIGKKFEEYRNEFTQKRWDLEASEGAEYGIQYREDSLRNVADKLEESAEYERMVDKLQWDSAKQVQTKLEETPAKGYNKMANLVGYYEEEYERLNAKVKELSGTLKDKEELLTKKTEQMKKFEQRLTQQKNNLIKRHKEKTAELEEQYSEMTELRQEAREDFKDMKKQKEQLEKQENRKIDDLRDRIDKWEQKYQMATAGGPVEKTMESAGQVLVVEPSEEIIMLEGGEDCNREKNKRYVIYAENPSGEKTVKGEVILSRIYDSTSQATILSQQEQMVNGDLFVAKTVWEQFQKAKQVAKAPQSAPEKSEGTTEEEPEKGDEEAEIDENEEEQPAKDVDTVGF
ncbi:MAG: hypothetical protein ACLFWL_14490 [Candidatus Brocadiia bacterium]